MNYLFTLFIGVLTMKEKCHHFDCKTLKSYKQPCQVSFDGHTAEVLGIRVPVHQYMWGPVEGFDGNDGTHEVSLFFKSGKIYKAYVSQYVSQSDYYRWTCDFPNKKACYQHLTDQ